MGSLTSCMKKAGAALHEEDRRAILARSAALRKDGLKNADAARQAIQERIEAVGAMTEEAKKPRASAKAEPEQEVAAPPVAAAPVEAPAVEATAADPAPAAQAETKPAPAEPLESRRSQKLGRLFAGFERSKGDGSARQGAADAASVLGLPALDVAPDASMPAEVIARVDKDTGALTFNPAMDLTAAEWTQVMVEELMHNADIVAPGSAMSAASPRLLPGGDIDTEARGVFDSGKGLADFLAYPLADDTLTAERTAAELFARLAVIYHGDRALLQRELPTAYEAIHAIFGNTVTGRDEQVLGSVPDRELQGRGQVPGAVESGAGNRQVADGPAAGTSAGDAGGAGGRRAYRRLADLRDRIAEVLDSPRDGGVIRGALESRTIAGTLQSRLNDAAAIKLPSGYVLGDLFNSAGKVSWWHKTVGTMHNLAERSPAFKRVYDSAQSFLNDVSSYAIEAADLAPRIIPKLETWRDLTKSPLSAEDTKALSAPVFEGTLVWTRGTDGKPVRVKDVEAAAEKMDAEAKARQLLRDGKITEGQLKSWQALPVDSYEGAVRNRYESEYLRGGIVWSDAELKSQFGLTESQIGLYREFRAATDKSLNDLAKSDMLRFAGKDADAVRQQVLDAATADEAAMTLRDHLYTLASQQADRADVLNDTADKIVEKADRVKDLVAKGYAPLSRFGQYFVSVKRGDEQLFFSLYEGKMQASLAARKMRAEFPDAQVSHGTMPQEAFKLFAGVSPETLELFGEMLGLEQQGSDASHQAFQQYLKVAKSNRSAMKRLIERKGIAGFSEDAGRVLAGFIYSNARQTSQNLHSREMTDSLVSIKENERADGELFDQASKLLDYVRNPQEEAGAFRGMLFAQYLGGNVASAIVNASQPLMVTFPYLSQFGGVSKAAGRMKAAVQDALKKSTGDAGLDAALKRAEADGIVSPQEVHHLQAQAGGRASLQTGDGTKLGDALAKTSNAWSKFSLAWGKVFSVAEQYNRRVTFIAAYRTAVSEGIENPAAFAERAVTETQFNYTKAARPRWARGAIGATLFTFKTYSISYVELLHRMWTRGGPEGKRATLLALGMLFLVSGLDGVPGADDAEDVLDGLLQRMGYNFSSKQAKREFLAGVLGEDGAQFVLKGVSGLPGVPIDVSGRMGLGNLVPGTGFFVKKQDYSRDIAEMAGPAGDFASRIGKTASLALDGEVGAAALTLFPTAARNMAKGYDMATTGMYRDDRGRKVIDADGFEAAMKTIGFQPSAVARVQETAGSVQQLVGLNKMMESEIAQKWAQGMFERDPGKVADARAMLDQWNADNPQSPIRIASTQILKRVREMSLSKAERLAKTAPAELRASVRQELEVSR